MKIRNATGDDRRPPSAISVTERSFSLIHGRLPVRAARRRLDARAIVAHVGDDQRDDRARTEDERAERPAARPRQSSSARPGRRARRPSRRRPRPRPMTSAACDTIPGSTRAAITAERDVDRRVGGVAARVATSPWSRPAAGRARAVDRVLGDVHACVDQAGADQQHERTRTGAAARSAATTAIDARARRRRRRAPRS